jgi:lipopolysaccharide export system ATP-binding protein
MTDIAIAEPDSCSARNADGCGLSIVSIAKAYDKRQVLHDVSLDVARGEVVGLLGPNGAG